MAAFRRSETRRRGRVIPVEVRTEIWTLSPSRHRRQLKQLQMDLRYREIAKGLTWATSRRDHTILQRCYLRDTKGLHQTFVKLSLAVHSVTI